LAAPFLVLAFIFIPRYFKRYDADFVWKKRADKENSLFFFNDLNQDGNDDEISFFGNDDGQAAVKITLFEDKIFGQYNMNGVFPFKIGGNFVNIDNDSLPEISMVYYRNDSAFISVLRPLDTTKLYVTDLFLDKILDTKKNVKITVTNPITYDLDHDGFNEIIFSLNAGFSLYPRNVYMVNVKKGSVKKSPYLAVLSYPDLPQEPICDLDNDGKPEILFYSSSPGNVKSGDTAILHDYSSWLIILDENLDFWIDPIEFKGTPSGIFYRIIKHDQDKKILYYFSNGSASGDSSCLVMFDPVTRKISDRNTNLPRTPIYLLRSFGLQNDMIFYDKEGNFYSVNDQLELVKVKKEKDFRPSGYITKKDLDNDGEDEIIHLDNDCNGLYIFRSNYSYPVFVDVFLPSASSLKNVSFYEIKGHQPMMVIHVDNSLYGYYYHKNRFYWVKWFVVAGIYLLFAALFFVVLRIQHILLHRKYKRDQNMAELKLRSIRNQMDPHFTFNAVNAIAGAIFKEDKDTAYRYFTKFSKLIRSTMLYSDKLSRFLDEEIDFTTKYLEIEKFRFREKFNFEINVDETIDLRNEVPRMIVQSLAETAVNNGLMHRLEGGLLKISIFEKDETIEIIVTDNGVGMERSKELNKEKAFKSVKIMEEFISGINELNDKPITLEMFDIFESGEVAGTRVIVHVPYGIRYCADTEVINKPLRLFHP